MGPRNNLVHFKSVLECLLINSWSSSQHLKLRVIPSLPSHLVIHFTLVKWFRFGWQDWWGEILALLLTTRKSLFMYLKALTISGPLCWHYQYASSTPLSAETINQEDTMTISCLLLIGFRLFGKLLQYMHKGTCLVSKGFYNFLEKLWSKKNRYNCPVKKYPSKYFYSQKWSNRSYKRFKRLWWLQIIPLENWKNLQF